MKTLSIALLFLIVMSGQLYADNHSAANNKITLNLDGTSEILVTGYIAPVGESLSDNFKQWDELVNLRVAEPEKQHPASVFQAFLPKNPVSVGELWVPDMTGIVNLLKQLHPNPNFFLHINAGDSFGLWACLRAYNDQYADIVFRIHAEFKLKDGWFTPSQFTGHLVVDRIAEKVAFFEMYVPDGIINFDVNWKREKNANYHVTVSVFVRKWSSALERKTFWKTLNSRNLLPKQPQNAHWSCVSTNRSKLTGYRRIRHWRWHKHSRSRFM